MLRRVTASEWTAAVLGALVVAAHVYWFVASEHQAEVLSGLGGSLTVLGILVATQPYIRKGVRQAGREQAGLEDNAGGVREREGDAEYEGVRHVIKERVVGVVLIGSGSLLNGYGPAIASVLHLKGS